MTLPADRGVLGEPLKAKEDSEPGRRTGFDAGPVWMRILPPAVMLALGLWRITGTSYGRDEAATLTAVQRPFGELMRMIGHVDAVHGAYYVIIWVLVRAAGTSELVTRLPSAVAMAAAAAMVAALGRRLVSPRAGLAAGLVFAVLPQISLYAQDAREYGIITALAATASYLLVRALTTAGRRRGWLAGYAACLALMGLFNVLSLLLIAAHAVTVALACARAGRRAARPLALGWLAAAVAAIAVASPVLALGFAQRGTLGAKPPSIDAVGLIGPAPLLAVFVTVALGIIVSALPGTPALRACWPAELQALCLPWLLLAPAVLIGISFASPVYTFRYVLFCVPAAALLAGAGLAALSRAAGGVLGGAAGWAAAATAFAAIAVLGAPAQLAERAPGYYVNIRAADQIVAATMHPGDAVLYAGPQSRWLPAAYPYGVAKLDDIAQAETPSQAGNLTGTKLPRTVVRHRLRHVSRVWVVRMGQHPHFRLLDGLGFRLMRQWHTALVWLMLFTRPPAS